MKHLLRLSLIAALLGTITPTIYSLTSGGVSKINGVVDAINAGTLTGSAIWETIQNLNLREGDDNHTTVKRLNRAAMLALQKQGYNVDMSKPLTEQLRNGIIPTVESRSTLVQPKPRERPPYRGTLEPLEPGRVKADAWVSYKKAQQEIEIAPVTLQTEEEKKEFMQQVYTVKQQVMNDQNKPANVTQRSLSENLADLEKVTAKPVPVNVPQQTISLTQAPTPTPAPMPTASPSPAATIPPVVGTNAQGELALQGTVDTQEKKQEAKNQIAQQLNTIEPKIQATGKETVEQLSVKIRKGVGDDLIVEVLSNPTKAQKEKPALFKKVINALSGGYFYQEVNDTKLPEVPKSFKGKTTEASQLIDFISHTSPELAKKITRFELVGEIRGEPITIGLSLTKDDITRFNKLLDDIIMDASKTGSARLTNTVTHNYQRAFTDKTIMFALQNLRSEFNDFIAHKNDVKAEDKAAYASALKKYLLIQYMVLEPILKEISDKDSEINVVNKFVGELGANPVRRSLDLVNESALELLQRLKDITEKIKAAGVQNPESILDDSPSFGGLKTKQNLADYAGTILEVLFRVSNYANPNEAIALLSKVGNIQKITEILKELNEAQTQNAKIAKKTLELMRDVFGTQLSGIENTINSVVAYSLHGVNVYYNTKLTEIKKIRADKDSTTWASSIMNLFGLKTKTEGTAVIGAIFAGIAEQLNSFVRIYCMPNVQKLWNEGRFNLTGDERTKAQYVKPTISKLYDTDAAYIGNQTNAKLKEDRLVNDLLTRLADLGVK